MDPMATHCEGWGHGEEEELGMDELGREDDLMTLADDDDNEDEEGEQGRGFTGEDFKSPRAPASSATACAATAGGEAAVAAATDTAETRHFYTFLGDKAGMEGVSKAEVARIVHEASVGSKFYQHQQRQDAKLQQKIQQIRAKLATLTEPQRKHLEDQADRELAAAERAHRSFDRVCVVVDLDAFFCAVEERDHPELKTKPMAVGGGVVCTANYVARKYGVRSAMPLFIARRLCPQLVVRPTRFDDYVAVAEQTRAIFREYDPRFRAGSLDEAYLDMTDCVRARAEARGIPLPAPGGRGPQPAAAAAAEEEEGEEADGDADGGGQGPHDGGGAGAAFWRLAEEVVAEMRGRVAAACRITCSAGIATSFCVAKVSSNENKPDGQFLVHDIQAYLRDAPVGKLPGIGRITERSLSAGLDIHTSTDLYDKRALIYFAFTPITAHFLVTRSQGLDLSTAAEEEARERKGISRERTFAAISRREEILQKLHELCAGLAEDMREAGHLQAKTVTLKLKSRDFNVTTRARSSATYIHSSDDLFRLAQALLLPQLPITLRLMGVRASSFKAKPGKGGLDAFLARANSSASGTRSSSGSGGGGGGGGGLGGAAAASAAAAAAAACEGTVVAAKRPRGIEQFLTKKPAGGEGQDGVDGDEEKEKEEEGGGSDDEVVVISGPAAAPASAAVPVPKKARYTCPICLAQPGLSLLEFNQHVDACLAKSDPNFVAPRRQHQHHHHQQQQQQQHHHHHHHHHHQHATSAISKAKKPAASRPLEHFFGPT